MGRRDAASLGRVDRDRLPRVTAYCTANAYRLEELMKFLQGRGKSRGAVPKQFDECIYTLFFLMKKVLTERLFTSTLIEERNESGGIRTVYISGIETCVRHLETSSYLVRFYTIKFIVKSCLIPDAAMI